jgi:hypothetical protein
MQGFVHDKLDCRQLHIDISHFCHAADEIAAPSQINQDCVFRTEYLLYWIADDYTLTQTTLVMLLLKLHIHCGSAIIVVSALNIYMYNVPNSHNYKTLTMGFLMID